MTMGDAPAAPPRLVAALWESRLWRFLPFTLLHIVGEQLERPSALSLLLSLPACLDCMGAAQRLSPPHPTFHAGSAVIYPSMPSILTNGFASSTAGRWVDCEV